MSGSWKPLKMDPGKGHGPDSVAAQGQRHPAPWARPATAAPCLLTSLHLAGELVVLQQGLHAGAEVLLQDGLHGRPPPAQAEVEVPEPEDLVEAGGDIRWGMSGREVCETPPPPPLCVYTPTPGQDTSLHPRKRGAAQDTLGAQGEGGAGVGGCPQLSGFTGSQLREPGTRPRFRLVSDCRLFWPWFSRLQTFLSIKPPRE